MKKKLERLKWLLMKLSEIDPKVDSFQLKVSEDRNDPEKMSIIYATYNYTIAKDSSGHVNLLTNIQSFQTLNVKQGKCKELNKEFRILQNRIFYLQKQK